MQHSRSGKAIMNTAAGFLYEIVSLVCGLVLPRLILSTFGSEYNGITSSITQFISCISLLKAGIGGVTRAALYKPLAHGDFYEISVIVNQTESFMRKIAGLFALATVIFAVVFPFVIQSEFSWLFIFSFVLIIAFSTFAQFYFGFTYQMLLIADQRHWVTALVNCVAVILNTVISVLLINVGCSIHIVKLESSVVFALSAVLLGVYVRKKYQINRGAKRENDRIKQRWDAFGQEVANFVNNNSDIIVLTVLTNLKEVSVFAVYRSVLVALKSVVFNLITGFGAAFGNMYAKEEYELMRKNMGIFEVVVFSVTTVLYSVTLVMIVPFVMLYTANVVDVEYSRPVFAICITMAGAIECFGIPYHTVVTAVGHYKQTRNGAFLEAGIHIFVAVVATIYFGMIGVAFGAIASSVYRAVRFARYLEKNILPRGKLCLAGHAVVSMSVSAIVYGVSFLYVGTINSAFDWIRVAVVTTLLAVAVTVLFETVFYPQDVKALLCKLVGLVKRTKKR